MKVKLHIQKAGTALYEGTYDVSEGLSRPYSKLGRKSNAGNIVS
jgi:hypothetical protein